MVNWSGARATGRGEHGNFSPTVMGIDRVFLSPPWFSVTSVFHFLHGRFGRVGGDEAEHALPGIVAFRLILIVSAVEEAVWRARINDDLMFQTGFAQRLVEPLHLSR